MEDVEVRNSDEGVPSEGEGGKKEGGEKEERERARKNAKGRWEWGGKVSDDEEISMT